jgi:hypothetical protein
MTLTPGTVGSSALGSFPATPIFNALVPKEGPRMVPFEVAFPTAPSFEIDLTMTVQQRRITVVQSVYMDCSLCDAPVTLQVENTFLNIEAAAGTQGYYPLLVPDTPKFIVSSTSMAKCILIFLNVPVPSTVWNSSGFLTGGPLAPVTPNSGIRPLAIAQDGGASPWTDHSGSTTGASQTIMAAVASGRRYFVRIKAPEAADLWINPTGGTAAVNGAGCFKIPQGALYENFPGESVYQAITGFCVTGALAFFAQSQEGN